MKSYFFGSLDPQLIILGIKLNFLFQFTPVGGRLQVGRQFSYIQTELYLEDWEIIIVLSDVWQKGISKIYQHRQFVPIIKGKMVNKNFIRNSLCKQGIKVLRQIILGRPKSILDFVRIFYVLLVLRTVNIFFLEPLYNRPYEK